MSKRSRIGARRHRIVVQSPANTTDAVGGSTITWSTLRTLWAEVRYKGIQGAAGPGGQFMDKNMVDFIVRGIDSVQVNDDTGARSYAIRQGQNVEFEGRNFEVLAVANEDSRGKFLRIVTTERPVG